MEDLLVSLACQLIVSKTELKIVVQKTQNRRSATTCAVNPVEVQVNLVIVLLKKNVITFK